MLAFPTAPPYDCATEEPPELEFRILGQLEAVRGKRALELGSPKQRALLALLLLHANEPVGRDHLIDELWGDAAPATVNAVLNVYLSRLRRLLANGAGEPPLLTERAGYVLRVRPERLDARRFEELLAQGRRQLADGDADAASATLSSALALWRGPPLADLAYEQFAQSEIIRLEELRLSALEERIEAELTLGRHEALVPNLEALVAQHPYRERLRGQLMLALYRAGRQAEALETYRRTRRTFADELGIEPGPRLQELERAILRHDPSLDAAAPAARTRERRAEARRPMLVLTRRIALAVVAVLAVAAGAVLVTAGRNASNRSREPVTLTGNSVAVIDPETATVVGEIPVGGGRPAGLAIAAGSVWVANGDDETLLRIDPRSRKIVRTIGLGARPTDLAVAGGSIWVLSDWAVRRVDPEINDVVATIHLPRRPMFPWVLLEAGASSIWVCSCATLDGALSHIDVGTNTIGAVREVSIGNIAFGEGALWALIGFQLETVERIDPKTNAVVASIPRARVGPTAGGDPRQITAGAGAVWIAFGKALWKLDPGTDRFVAAVSLGHTPHDVAIHDRAIWIVTADRMLLRVDPESQRVAKAVRLGVYPAPTHSAIAVGEGAVWVAVTA